MWEKEWLENLREAGEGYKCYVISMRTTVLKRTTEARTAWREY